MCIPFASNFSLLYSSSSLVSVAYSAFGARYRQRLSVMAQYGRTLYDCVDRTALLAQATVYAFCHVDIISSSPSTSIFTLFCFNYDGLCWADSFAELASDASLLATWVSSQRMFSSESR